MQVDPKRMKEARDNQLLTVEQAAELAGVSRGTIWRLETGKGGGWQRSIKALARVYGVDPRELLASTTRVRETV